jgi:threonine/homoserine/homoserine lactone efflux protein
MLFAPRSWPLRGIGSASLHLTFALLGLSAILITFPAIYVAVRLLGAAYLMYLGTRELLVIFRARGPQTITTGVEKTSGASGVRS